MFEAERPLDVPLSKPRNSEQPCLFPIGPQYTAMKIAQSLTVALVALTAALSLHAEPPKIEHVIDVLQKAKESNAPLKQLEHAKKMMSDYDPVSGNQLTAAGSGPRRTAGMEVAGHDRKREAMEAIGRAIQAAKAHEDVKPKIESAIAKVHYAGALKH